MRSYALVLLSFLPAALRAQQNATDAPAADTTALPSVTVTATRTDAATLRAPLAVTAVSTSDLRATRGIALDEALRLVPGVLAQSRAGGTDVRLVIRGFGARGAGDRSNAGTSRGVRVLLDGIPETEPDGRTAFDQIDLDAAERIEVVRSNASALWGNAAGGVVAVSSVPGARAPRLDLRATAGSFGLARGSLRAATTSAGGAAAWTTLTRTDWDGWRAHSMARRTLLNAGAAGAIGERTRVTFLAAAADNLFRIPGPLSREQLERDPGQANATYAARDERRHNRIARLGATLRHDRGPLTAIDATLFASPKHLQRSERGSYRDFTRYHVGGSVVARTGRAVGEKTIGIAVGADEAYQDGAILFYSLTPQGTRGTTLRDNKREGANNTGVFTQAELRTERLTLDAGLRWDDITYDHRSYVDRRLTSRKSFRRATPKLGAAWSVAPRHAVYASIGGGIEAPAGNETDPAGTFGSDTVYAINPLLDAIRSTTYEIGARSAGLSRGSTGVGYDVAVYLTDVRNEIVPYQGGRFYFTAGRARRSGVELGLDAAVAQGPFARAAISLSRNRYVDYVVDSVHYQRPGAVADYSGNGIVGIPSAIANAELGWTLGGVRLKGVIEGVGRYWVDDANTVRVPGYTVVHALAELDALPVGGGWGVGGFAGVYNVGGRLYTGSAFLNPERVGGRPLAFEPGAPRSVVVSLSIRRAR